MQYPVDPELPPIDEHVEALLRTAKDLLDDDWLDQRKRAAEHDIATDPDVRAFYGL